MKILVACECSQIVTAAFREKGHDAFSCDILDCYGGHPEWHIKDDVLNHLDDGWDMLIGFPPCTYLTNASSCRLFSKTKGLNQDRYNKLLAARDFFYKLWECDIPLICLENPVPMKISGLPFPSCEVNPWEFGHNYTKKTYLWLKNLPPLLSTDLVVPCYSYVMSTRSPGIRSKFHPGIAAAMADQWGSLCLI